MATARQNGWPQHDRGRDRGLPGLASALAGVALLATAVLWRRRSS